MRRSTTLLSWLRKTSSSKYIPAVQDVSQTLINMHSSRTKGKGLWATPHFVILFSKLSHLISAAQIATQKTVIDKQIAGSTTTPLQKAHFKLYKDWMSVDDVGAFEVTLAPISSRSKPATTGKNYVTFMSGVRTIVKVNFRVA